MAEKKTLLIRICPCCRGKFETDDLAQFYCDVECEGVARANPELFKKAQKEGLPLL